MHLIKIVVAFIELCNAAVPFVMLSEILDTITIDNCEKVFEFVEDRVSTWKSVSYIQIIPNNCYSLVNC